MCSNVDVRQRQQADPDVKTIFNWLTRSDEVIKQLTGTSGTMMK